MFFASGVAGVRLSRRRNYIFKSLKRIIDVWHFGGRRDLSMEASMTLFSTYVFFRTYIYIFFLHSERRSYYDVFYYFSVLLNNLTIRRPALIAKRSNAFWKYFERSRCTREIILFNFRRCFFLICNRKKTHVQRRFQYYRFFFFFFVATLLKNNRRALKYSQNINIRPFWARINFQNILGQYLTI